MMKLVFISSVPSFYKNLLFKELQRKAMVRVHFTNRSKIKRTPDFYKFLDEDIVIKTEGFVSSFFKILKESRSADFIYYGGWDDLLYWCLIPFIPKRKNRVILESSIYDRSHSKTQGLLDLLKRVFLTRISVVVASGVPHAGLLKSLKFKGRIVVSGGVGVLDFHYLPVVRQRPVEIKNFLFVGRMNEAKGIDLLLSIFADRPDMILHLVGDDELGLIPSDSPNIVYHGYRTREQLKDIFALCDVVVLASKHEPWGLVIEEALYHGLPVIVSEVVGCRINIVEEYNVGLISKTSSRTDLLKKIDAIRNNEIYNKFTENIKKINFHQRKDFYVNCFLNEKET